jgi:hypothetical protein
MTTSELEPATFRLIELRLNRLRYRVPKITCINYKYEIEAGDGTVRSHAGRVWAQAAACGQGVSHLQWVHLSVTHWVCGKCRGSGGQSP